MPPPVNKLVLAVHGIGDQTRNSTILSAAEQFCHHFGYRALLPLGGFYDTLQDGHPALMIEGPTSPAGLNTMGFAEIYWADLARAIETAGYTLEETKAWCRSVVSRIRVLAEQRQPGRTDIHYGQIEYVMEEAIDAIAVIESLLFLARKAGVLDFDLKRILDDYLGDVQLVAEFTDVRAGIVGRLHTALGNAHTLYPNAEIYVVAHSEGTVVAWLGLLAGVTDPEKYPWIKQVRGFMTIGSPIDKHLILWPDLFTSFKAPHPSLLAASGWSSISTSTIGAGAETGAHPPIRWINYVDNGDPVGFELDTARWWMHQRDYDRVFNFTPDDDYYFTRYPVPGKAHTDYWTDADVFQHFIMTVVAPPQLPSDPPPPARREALKNGPRSRWIALFTSYVVAYLIPLAAVFAAVYFLTKGVEQYLDPKGEQEHLHLIRNTLALGILLAGATTWLRLTQITRFGLWHFGGALIYAASVGLYYLLVVSMPDLVWFGTMPAHLRPEWSDPREGLIVISVGLLVITMLANARWLRTVLAKLFPKMMAVSPDGAMSAFPASASRPHAPAAVHPPLFRNTIRVMLILGTLALIANTLAYAHYNHPVHAPLWPIVMGGAAFLYLWRLSALVFDLVFIWHRYIRQSGAMAFLRRAILPAGADKASPASGGRRR